ncbi:hydrolase 1, exosortase A system-associated [Sphingomonas sp. SUN019]|uniref:hydrolase 1, exosortase A system-associated n=1 Tax=Sphingomonas sp. SUN019 TaxID=2937788 RepID=UPI002164BEE8|nr:hydrolase 1, exosortase A system-associated [Sphingomonas sp. SUN019]UVO52176.1 hydrolase 1, exosortase A system-associated [Sphingomonas sp. SUN019]
MRRLIAFDCADETLVGTLDEAAGVTGLLIISGGNEIRAGAHRGMALMAARLASEGTPVFRYDRRGVGDSTGPNTGYEDARDDLIAAVDTFRANAPKVTRIVGFGNCDGATTLALFGRAAGIDAGILANPWVVETTDALPPPAAIRARYAAKLRDPREWWRLARGDVSMVKLISGLRRISTKANEDQSLSERAARAIAGWSDDATVVLAKDDATALAYVDAARRANIAPRTITIDTASHSFARSGDAASLEAAILDALSR